MIRKDLFEVLRDKVHCEYISDLKYISFERIRNQLKQLNYDDFELKEILDAINWFGDITAKSTIKEDAWNELLGLNI